MTSEMLKSGWIVLHVWLGPDGSGTAFSIDLGSYAPANSPAKRK